ncbi:hypothetical protein [Demequina maris]|uniref:hypothetical protein n=1 Tax=Demequina maris TaxID=1638982 RepID=UPI0007811960|nr:hypothetical protein [Demequina maris]
MIDRPHPWPTPTSVAEALTLAAADAAGTMRGRGSRALAGLDAVAVDVRRRRRVLRVVLAVGIVALLGAGVVRVLDPPVALADQLVDAIAAGDGAQVDALVADGALAELEEARPTEAVRLAAAACDLSMLRRLTDAGARRFADNTAREDAALSMAIRGCPSSVIRGIYADTPSSVPPISLMVFAASEGSPTAVRTLAGLGLPIDGEDGVTDPSPLEAAIRAGRADTANALVELGADTRLRTRDGKRLGLLLAQLPDAADCSRLGESVDPARRDACARAFHGGRP